MVGNILIAVAIMVALVELQLKLATNRIILLDAALFADKPSDENTEHVSEQRTAFSSELRCHESPTHNMTIRSEWFVPPVAAIAANGAAHACELSRHVGVLLPDMQRFREGRGAGDQISRP